MRCAFAILILLVVSGSVADWANAREDKPAKLTDEEITKLLVGKWSYEETRDKLTIRQSNHFTKDGKFEAEMSMAINGEKPSKGTLSGTWLVKDGVLIPTVTKASEPSLKLGPIKIVSIDEKSLKYKPKSGAEIEHKRVK